MKILDYIFATRPLLHLPLWSVYLVSLHYHQEPSGEHFNLNNLFMLCALSLMGAAAYYINQIYDFDSDKLNKKLGFLQKGMLSVKELKIAYIVLSLLSLCVSLWFSWAMLVVFLQLFILGYFYSVPPMRLKDRPISGFLANSYGYGFLVPLTVMPEINISRLGSYDWIISFYFFLTIGAIYILTTLPDRRGDEATGKRTLGVVLPRISTLLLAFLLMALSVYVAFYAHFHLLMYLSLLTALLILLSIFINSPSFDLLIIKLPILLLTILAGYFYWGYMVFIIALLIANRIYYRKRLGIVYPKLM